MIIDDISTAQDSIVIENPSSYHASALKSLQRAKEYANNGAWDAAYSESELGLAYDAHIADLYYIKAFSLVARNASPSAIIPLLKTSLAESRGTWYEYNPDAARLLLAQMYIQTTKPTEALELLDQSPTLFSQEAFLIRSYAHYTLGNIQEARQFVEEGAKQYPYDSRFDLLFFENEYARKMEQEYKDSMAATSFEDEFPVIDKLAEREDFSGIAITDELEYLSAFFVSRAEQLSRDNPDVLLFASAFSVYDEEKNRLLREWNAQGHRNPWYGVYALQAGLMSEKAALCYMLPFFSSNIDYDCLKAFVSLLHDSSVIEELRAYFAGYSGSINFDLNADLMRDMTVVYKRGRPLKIEYDKNQDGLVEWIIDCDYGVPIKISIPDENIVGIYGVWPALSRVTDSSGSPDEIIYDISSSMMDWTPIQLIRDPVLEMQTNIVLYIPVLDASADRFPYERLFNSAFTIDAKTSEYDESRVRFTLLHGIIRNATYTENGTPYAYGHFEGGKLQFRNVDRDKNGSYELVELYEYDPSNSYKFQSAEEEFALSERLFGFTGMAQGLYLYKVAADLDDDGINDFTEEYLAGGGYIAKWDINVDGNWDIQFIQSADEGKHEVRYIHPISKETISIQVENGIPLFANGQAVIKDPAVDFYWLREYPGPSYAEIITARLNLMGGSGVILAVAEIKEENRVTRILGVKNGDMYFGEVFYE